MYFKVVDFPLDPLGHPASRPVLGLAYNPNQPMVFLLGIASHGHGLLTLASSPYWFIILTYE
jgi:hypothetical protein